MGKNDKRNKILKERYKQLREAGYSAKEATKYKKRSGDFIKTAISDFIKEQLPIPKTATKKEKSDKKPSTLKTDARKTLIRENYAMLKNAGFSAKEANRYRNASRQKVLEAINQKTIPAPKPEYRRAKPWVKERVKEYKSSTSVIIEMKSISDKAMNRAFNMMQPHINDDFNYYSIRIEAVLKDGTTHIWQTPMNVSGDLGSAEQLSDQISSIIEGMLAMYVDNEEENLQKVNIEIVMWKPMIKAG